MIVWRMRKNSWNCSVPCCVFWFSLEYFALVLFAFVGLGLVSSVLCQEGRLQKDLFCVEWDLVLTQSMHILLQSALCVPGAPLPPYPFTSPSFTAFLLLTFLIHYLFYYCFHPFPFYPSSPIPFPGQRSYEATEPWFRFWLLSKRVARVEVNVSLAFLQWVRITLHS